MFSSHWPSKCPIFLHSFPTPASLIPFPPPTPSLSTTYSTKSHPLPTRLSRAFSLLTFQHVCMGTCVIVDTHDDHKISYILRNNYSASVQLGEYHSTLSPSLPTFPGVWTVCLDTHTQPKWHSSCVSIPRPA